MLDDRPILRTIPEAFVGERIIVRPYVDDDTGSLHDAIQESIEHLRPWMFWYASHGSLDDTRAYIRTAQANWILRTRLEMGIFERDSGAFLGGLGLRVHSWELSAFSIGYWARRSAEGHGYIGEAARLLTIFAFDRLQAQRVVITCDARNARSAAVPERLGYVLEGTLRRNELNTDGRPRDTRVYAMIPDDYDRVRHH